MLPREARGLLDAPTTERKKLSGLGADAMGRVAGAAIGAAPLGPGMRRWLQDKSEGNAFFAQEIAMALVESGTIGVLGGKVIRAPSETELGRTALPPTVEALVLGRVENLGPAAQKYLKVASVVGRRFKVIEIEALVQEKGGEDEIRGALETLESARLLNRERDHFTFTHQITRDITYRAFDADERAGSHRRYAEWLERGDAEGRPQEFGRLAHHWHRAGVIDKTLDCLERASAEGLRQGAYEDVVGFLREALRLDESQPGTTPPQRRGQWHVSLAQACLSLGENVEGGEHAAIALEQLGSSMPRTRLEWLSMTVKQMLIQVVHLVWNRRSVRLGTEAHDRARNTVRAAEIQSDFRYYSNDTLAQLGLILLSANTADRGTRT